MAFSPRKSHPWKSVRRLPKSSCYIWHV